MLSSYGSYTHADKELTPQVSAEMLRTNMEQLYAVRFRITLNGCLHGDTQSALIAEIQSLQAAYSVDYQDFCYKFADGTNTPDLCIRNADTIGGMRVISPPVNVPQSGAEYSTFWHYTLMLEATVRLSAIGANTLWEYGETIDIKGTAGPQFKHVPLKYFPWQKQRPRNFSLCTATQSGFVTGLFAPRYDLIPPPMWPNSEIEENRTISRPEPQRKGSNFTVWRLDYSYQFESNTPLTPGPYRLL